MVVDMAVGCFLVVIDGSRSMMVRVVAVTVCSVMVVDNQLWIIYQFEMHIIILI